MGFGIARVAFSDGTTKYTAYTTVTDHCFRELVPTTAAEASWIMGADTREETDQRLDTVCRKHVGMSWDEYQRARTNAEDADLRGDVEEVRITVPNYDDEGWTTKASKGTRLVVLPTSLEGATEERERQERSRIQSAGAVATAQAQEPRRSTLRWFFNRFK